MGKICKNKTKKTKCEFPSNAESNVKKNANYKLYKDFFSFFFLDLLTKS